MTTLAMDSNINYQVFDIISAPSVYERRWNNSLPDIFAPSSKSMSTRIDLALSFLHSQGVLLKDRLLIETYIANNIGIVSHIYDVPKKVFEYFDSNDIEMGVFSDPDTDDDSEIYFELITSLLPEEANHRLSSLNRDWILSSSDEDLMKINFTLKFV